MTDLSKHAENEGLSHDEAREAIKAAGRRKHRPPEMSRVMTMAEVAAGLGRPTWWVRRKLIAKGVAFQETPRGHWLVTRNDLRVAFRKYWVELEMDAASR